MQITTKLRRITLFLFSMVLSSGILLAQERTVTGKVTAEGEGPVPGVNVTVQGTVIGAMTSVDGSYSLKVPGPTSVLVFSSVGYVTQSVTVGSQAVIDVLLVSDVRALQEVIVTGYTQQRKRDLTGSVGVVETDKLKAVPTGNVTNQLQGRTSGITVVGNGQPGSTAKLRIRGFGSFENNDPLYIVDGVPTQDIDYLNPNDVEGISVLKDAGAASVYGSRASNGVVVITTKKGTKGIKVTYDMYYGTQQPGKGPINDILNSQEYANLQWLVYKNDGTSETHPVYGPSSNATPTLPSWAANTDWWDELTNPAPIQNHDLSLSGGTDNAKFYGGFGYFDQKGIILYNYSRKYNTRFNSEFTFLKNRLKVGEHANINFNKWLGVSNLDEGSPVNSGPYRLQPIIPVVWTGAPYVGLSHTFVAGDWGGTGIAPRLGNSGNTVASLTRDKDDNYWSVNMIGSAYVDVNILKGLNFRSTFGGTWYNGYHVNYSFATYESAENALTPTLEEYANYGGTWNWTNTLTFDKTIGQHKILALLGYEAVKYGMGREVSATKAGYFSDALDFRTITNGATMQGMYSNFWTPTTLASTFMKADYGFMDRYFLSATVRRDGSSRFGKDNRYGIFPSFSAAWRIGDEAFLNGVSWITDLKIRGSYGTMGNQLAVSPMNQFFLFGGDVTTTNYDLNGTGTGSLQGFRPVRIGNPDAKWETNISTDIGFEGRFFDDKFGIVFDWYLKKTKDLLFNPELPGTAGSADQPYINIASMTNKGIDGELSFRNTWGDFGINASAVLTTYKNKITKIAEGVDFFDYGGATTRIGSGNRNMVGHPIASFYGYQTEGLFQSAADVSESPKQDGAEAGFLKFANLDDSDNEITPSDRTFIGNPNPDFTYGLNLTLTYKNFDVTGFIYGSQGADIFNWNRWWIDFWPSFQGQKSKALLYDSWTTSNTSGTVPKASNKSNFSTNTVVCSYYMEDGSFLKLKNLQVGYTFPKTLLSKVGIGSLRVYLQGVNLLTITKYSGLDPELGGDDRAFGSDTGNYPMVKQFIFGINLTL
jgi:TonB-dependent starch-binding outer membrane protein SusC